jgi:hypothetical protein
LKLKRKKKMNLDQARRKVNASKINFLLLQGTGYLFLAFAALIWAKYAKGIWKYVNYFFGLVFLFWGIINYCYIIYLIYNKPIKIYNYPLT